MSNPRSIPAPTDFIEMVLDTLFHSRPVQEDRRHRSRPSIRRKATTQTKAPRTRRKRAA